LDTVPGNYIMTMDQETERHYEIWLGFTRLMRWVVGIIVVALLLMAYFLV
jgi:hypothetical protein